MDSLAWVAEFGALNNRLDSTEPGIFREQIGTREMFEVDLLTAEVSRKEF